MHLQKAHSFQPHQFDSKQLRARCVYCYLSHRPIHLAHTRACAHCIYSKHSIDAFAFFPRITMLSYTLYVHAKHTPFRKIGQNSIVLLQHLLTINHIVPTTAILFLPHHYHVNITSSPHHHITINPCVFSPSPPLAPFCDADESLCFLCSRFPF